eukprot:COSAG06_NODE_64934_length_258_cov_0.654088_1_plen_66_part_00
MLLDLCIIWAEALLEVYPRFLGTAIAKTVGACPVLLGEALFLLMGEAVRASEGRSRTMMIGAGQI